MPINNQPLFQHPPPSIQNLTNPLFSLQTYTPPLYSPSLHDSLLHNWTRPDGWHAQLLACQTALLSPTPNTTPGNTTTTPPPTHNCTFTLTTLEAACFDTFTTFARRGPYDIAHPAHDPFPPPHARGWLAREEVLAALGVPVNYTAVSAAVAAGFEGSWDMLRGGGMEGGEAVGGLLDGGLGLDLDGGLGLDGDLDGGVKVHLVYGDRDFMANWVGGEGMAEAVPWEGREVFKGAGYARFLVDGDGDGKDDNWKGLTKQVGRFSFTRMFQAGHEVPAYQPRASYELFRRAMGGWDVPTGKVKVGDGFVTQGRRDAWVESEAPEMPSPRCYVLKPDTCEPEVWQTVVNGTALVKDWFVVEESSLEEPKGGLEDDEL